MARAETQHVLVRTTKYCWLYCDYSMSGSTLTWSLTFHWDGGDAQLDNAYIRKDGTNIWSNTGRVHNYEGKDTRGEYNLAIANGTTSISGTQTITFGITKYSGVYLTGSFTVTAATAPSGASVTFNSATWNSINITSKVNSWGTGYSGTPNLEQIVVAGSATSSTWQNTGRQVKGNSTTSTTSTQSVTTANSTAYSGGATIKGAMDFKVAAWASTSVGNTNAFDNTLRYTPPAPLASLTYTQAQNSTDVGVTATITGGSSTNNYGNTVTTQYRYSTNGGSSYSSWTSAGTGTPWTAKTASFTCAYGASVIIQARQEYHGQYSETKSVSFTATNGTAPTAGDVTITGSTWNSVTLQASGVNYGKPDGISGRKLAIGVRIGPNDSSYKRENQVENVTSATTTVTNSSIYPSAQPLQLKGMLPVYSYLWVWNTKTSATTSASTTPYYLPPAPGTANYVADGDGDYTISYTGVAENNVTNYAASDLTRTVRWTLDGSVWIYVEDNTQIPLTTVTTDQIHVPFGRTATVEAWLTYFGKNSEVSTFTITNQIRPAHFYGSVAGLSKEVQHLYGSVNGQSKKIKKLYGSAGGVAKEVFEDV